MPRPIVSMMVIFTLLVLGIILLALRSCESPSPEPQEPIPNQEETTAPPTEPGHVQYSNEHIQYSSDLPHTGGIHF